jgi:hypothetical protein
MGSLAGVRNSQRHEDSISAGQMMTDSSAAQNPRARRTRRRVAPYSSRRPGPTAATPVGRRGRRRTGPHGRRSSRRRRPPRDVGHGDCRVADRQGACVSKAGTERPAAGRDLDGERPGPDVGGIGDPGPCAPRAPDQRLTSPRRARTCRPARRPGDFSVRRLRGVGARPASTPRSHLRPDRTSAAVTWLVRPTSSAAG